MKRFTLVMAGFLVSVVVLPVTVKAEGIKEGKWSMTMVTKMEGMPAEAAAAMKEMENMPPEAAAMMKQMQGKMGFQMHGNDQGITTTVTQCMTNQNPVPNRKAPENCQQTHKINGNTVTFHVACNSKAMHMDSTGHVTYSGDSMAGQIKSQQVAEGSDMDVTIDISGKYLGPCS